mgnify:FL=1
MKNKYLPQNKYLLYLAFILTVLIILSGFKAYNNRLERDIQAANGLYREGRYAEAGEIYRGLLQKNPEDERLSYNLATVYYKTGGYQEALEFFQKGPESPEKYLLMGNICYEKGQEELDPVEKINLYQEALQYYREGMVNFPREIELKYNYEYVREELEKVQEEMEEQMEQSSGGQEDNEDEDGENQDDSSSQQEDFSQENQDESNPGEEEKGGEEGDREQELDNQEENKQEEETGNEGERQEERQEGKQEEESAGTQQEGQEKEGQDREGSREMEGEKSREEILQILKMLEAEEEDSLKNNQSLYQGSGKEEKYDW